jgi:hypothetical protein
MRDVHRAAALPRMSSAQYFMAPRTDCSRQTPLGLRCASSHNQDTERQYFGVLLEFQIAVERHKDVADAVRTTQQLAERSRPSGPEMRPMDDLGVVGAP